jgi:hypothetical protein
VYEEHFWKLQPIRYQYLYVGLPALDAVEYVQGESWLGVALAALMRVPPSVPPGLVRRRCGASAKHR